MPRSLVLGNGTMLATFDERLQMRDLYYPYVGMEDQTTYGHVHRVGMMTEGKGFAWWDDPSWTVQPRYEAETLVGDSLLTNDRLGLHVVACDYVHPVHNVLIRHLKISSTDKTEKRVRCFFHHDFHIYGDKQKDTAFYEPYTNSVIHYREKRYILVGAQTDRPIVCSTGERGGKFASILRSMEEMKTCGISQFCVGKADYRGLEGTWRDAEDGELSGNPIEQGSVDSTVAVHCIVPAEGTTDVILWLCLDKNLPQVLQLQQLILRESPDRLHRNCRNYWKSWTNKIQRDFGSLPPDVVELYKRSLLTIRTHVDNHGGIVAAADSDIMAFNRDTYTYVWPRDGAFVSLALDRAGYGEVTRKFFTFCSTAQTPDGYMLHKYNPDGSVGSSWHPWIRNGHAQLPIQEDETALPLYALWKHFEDAQDFEFIQDMYERFMKKAADFLTEFRDPETGLPLPSYDPWEEHRGIFTYTTASVVAGLQGAAHIAHALGHLRHSERYQAAADEVRQALLFHLFDEKEQRFVKKISKNADGTWNRDLTPDASIAAIWMLGILPADDPRVVSTMEQLQKALTVHTDVGGLARYPVDHYHGQTNDYATVPGNPWIITTLWLAQWQIAKAKRPEDLEEARAILSWASKKASPAGLLPEQMHPYTGAPLSVAPLTWSHATFVDTVLLFLAKEKEFWGIVTPK